MRQGTGQTPSAGRVLLVFFFFFFHVIKRKVIPASLKGKRRKKENEQGVCICREGGRLSWAELVEHPTMEDGWSGRGNGSVWNIPAKGRGASQKQLRAPPQKRKEKKKKKKTKKKGGRERGGEKERERQSGKPATRARTWPAQAGEEHMRQECVG
ncbi:hypothetical protein LY78DRAFT_416721 [Colletotrichum sublineola]|nr:hypothetical protein LY78DRAFT_416721 [Colletotrichum sublineola]